MKPRIVIRPLADLDLDLQAAYFARTSLKTALRFYKATDKAFQTIADIPGIGSAWGSSDPNLRELRVWPVRGFRKHLIFYQPIEGGIEVVRVLHASRDIESIFGK